MCLFLYCLSLDFRQYDGKSVKTEKNTSSSLKTMLNHPDKLEKKYFIQLSVC